MMKSITDYTRSEIEAGLTNARQQLEKEHEQKRIFLSPCRITEKNFEAVCSMFCRLDERDYDTVVIVEEHHEVLEKKLPMAAGSAFETPLGRMAVDDDLRNDFCDEGDDFFIHEEAFEDVTTRTHQLMMLQTALENVEVLNIKIADENHFIVKELVHVLAEVLASSNALVIFCCERSANHPEEMDHLKALSEPARETDLLNYLHSGRSTLSGSAAFTAGVMVAARWGMPLHFLENQPAGALLAYAERSHVMY